jgi:asparagine synthase (glutamine-hydrolysing)
MCGFAGFLDTHGKACSPVEWPQALARMGNAIAHRGPDDHGEWCDAPAGIGLAHRRLSILDLSPAGHQPMASASGRFVIAFNGEIYNHLELRAALSPGPSPRGGGESTSPSPWGGGVGERAWRGHSDTETLLAAFEAWGIEATLKATVGMFAIALWDRDTRTLTLARDRLGEKPLYYGQQDGVLLFGSELKALRAHPAFQADIDRDALALFMRFAYVPAPRSIYRGIFKLPPGTYLQVHSLSPDPSPRGGGELPVAYWSAAEACAAGQRDIFKGSDADAVVELERLLGQAVAGQMLADVPLGAFLSGGVDSSTIVALMQARAARPVKTFTIGFHEAAYNEAEHARAVAHHLGAEHTELYVTADEALAVIPHLPSMYDEPFGDSSQIPTHLVSRMTRGHVTVSLSGDAGDELFGGYNRYFWTMGLWRRLGRMPRALRATLARALTLPSPAAWNALLRPLAPLLPAGHRYANPGDKLHKLAGTLGAASPLSIYRDLTGFWPGGVAREASDHLPVLDEADDRAFPDFEHTMMALDLTTYLPDDILVKVDRAAMAVSLETRVPLLDHRVVEFAWRLPLAMKIRDGQGKWLLRQVLYKHVPRELIERPKQGFGVPLDAWLRGPLRDWAEALLEPVRLEREGWLDAAKVREKWDEHLSGRRNWSYYLWNALMFQAWLEAQG